MGNLFDLLIELDKNLFFLINSKAGIYESIDSLLGIVAGDYLVPVMLSLGLIFLWFQETAKDRAIEVRKRVLIAICSLLGSCLLVMIINELFFRERPFNLPEAKLIFYAPTDSSFPSNSTAAMFGLSIPILKTRMRVGMMMLLASMCLAICRVYVGVHFPGDVIGGVLVALLSFCITILLFKVIDKQLMDALVLFEKSKWLKVFRL